MSKCTLPSTLLCALALRRPVLIHLTSPFSSRSTGSSLSPLAPTAPPAVEAVAAPAPPARAAVASRAAVSAASAVRVLPVVGVLLAVGVLPAPPLATVLPLLPRSSSRLPSSSTTLRRSPRSRKLPSCKRKLSERASDPSFPPPLPSSSPYQVEETNSWIGSDQPNSPLTPKKKNVFHPLPFLPFFPLPFFFLSFSLPISSA